LNYQKIYNSLIARAVGRTIDAFSEVHHIIPRCLGGDDHEDNLVRLTPEEHYVAHQLLAKLYPDNFKITYAAIMMCANRPSNKLYGWLRRKHSTNMSVAQSGINNSQFGSMWVFNSLLHKNKKIKTIELQEYLDNGWQPGRVYDFTNTHQICKVCNTKFRHFFKKNTCSDICHQTQLRKYKTFEGKEDELKQKFAQTKSINKSLKAMGYPGAISHYYYWAKSVLKA